MFKNFKRMVSFILLFICTLLLVSSKLVSATTLEDSVKSEGTNIEARSALLMEPISGKIVYEKNIDEQYAPASVTKIMTMLLTMESVDNGKISLDDKVTCSENAKKWVEVQCFLIQEK